VDKVINVKRDVHFEVFTAILKNAQVFCDVGLMCHDISGLFLALKIEALCAVCKLPVETSVRLTENSLQRTLRQICAKESNTEKNYLTVWNVVLKSNVYICFNIWDGVLITRHVRVFVLLWQGMAILSPNNLSQILIIMPVQCLSCEKKYGFLNISYMKLTLYQLRLGINRRRD